jgi:flagellar hook-length control protein FliK
MPPLPVSPPAKTSAPPSAPRGASPPPGAARDFAALLNQTSARTASAEGPKTRPAQTEQRRRDAAAPKDDNKGADAPDAAAVAAQPAPAQDRPVADGTQDQAASDAQGQTPPQGGEAETEAGGQTPVQGRGVVAAAVQTAAVVAVPTVATPLGGAAATASGAGVQGAAGVAIGQPGSVVATGGQPAAVAAASTDGAPTDGAPAGKLQIPAGLLGAKGGHSKDFKNGDQPQRDLPPAPTLPPTTDAAAAGASTPPSAAAAAVAGPGAAAQAQPTFTTQAQPAATPQTAVPVATGAPQLTRASVLQTAERVQELVRIATTRAGNARATLQLRPAELGQVDVHLRTTRNGLVATIAAHEQVGLDALQQAGNELRRTLEDRGVQLHSLDLQLGAGHHGFSNQGDAREANSGRRGGAGGPDSRDLGEDDLTAEDQLTITHAPSAPAGALVDVQA